MWGQDWQVYKTINTALGKLEIICHKGESYFLSINQGIKFADWQTGRLEDVEEKINDILQDTREQIEEYLANNTDV